jgi:hypothetical protein
MDFSVSIVLIKTQPKGFSVSIVLITTRPKEFKGHFSIHSPYQDPTQRDFSVSIVLIKTRSEYKGQISCYKSQSIWQSEETPSKKENKTYKKLQERKLTKTKAKEIDIPMPREDPQEQSPSRHDAPSPPVRRSWSSICYRGRKEIESLDFVL